MSYAQKTILFLCVLVACFGNCIAQNKNFKEYRFFINPGHGGHDSDDRNIPATGFWESESNLEKGLYLRGLLEEEKAKVFISRTTNTSKDDLDFAVIDEMANAANVDFFLSIHSNAGSGQVNRPLLLYRGSDSSPTFKMASNFARTAWQNIFDIHSTWTHTDPNARGDLSFYPDWGTQGLAVLRNLAVPGVLSEGSFHDYLPESWRLRNSDYLHHEAWALFRAFKQQFGVIKESNGIVAGIVRDAVKEASWKTSKNSPDAFQPIDGVKVTLQPVNRTYLVDKQKNGYYHFDDVKPGTYMLYVQSEKDYSSDSASIVVAPNRTTQTDFKLKKK